MTWAFIDYNSWVCCCQVYCEGFVFARKIVQNNLNSRPAKPGNTVFFFWVELRWGKKNGRPADRSGHRQPPFQPDKGESAKILIIKVFPFGKIRLYYCWVCQIGFTETLDESKLLRILRQTGMPGTQILKGRARFPNGNGCSLNCKKPTSFLRIRDSRVTTFKVRCFGFKVQNQYLKIKARSKSALPV